MSQKRKHKRKNNKPAKIVHQAGKDEEKRIHRGSDFLEVALFMLVTLGIIWFFKKEIEIWDILQVLLLGFVCLIAYFLCPLIYKITYKQATKPLTNSRVIVSLLAVDIVLQAITTLIFYYMGWIIAAVISFCVINGIFIWIYISGKKAGRV